VPFFKKKFLPPVRSIYKRTQNVSFGGPLWQSFPWSLKLKSLLFEAKKKSPSKAATTANVIRANERPQMLRCCTVIAASHLNVPNPIRCRRTESILDADAHPETYSAATRAQLFNYMINILATSLARGRAMKTHRNLRSRTLYKIRATLVARTRKWSRNLLISTRTFIAWMAAMRSASRSGSEGNPGVPFAAVPFGLYPNSVFPWYFLAAAPSLACSPKVPSWLPQCLIQAWHVLRAAVKRGKCVYSRVPAPEQHKRSAWLPQCNYSQPTQNRRGAT
jgi:hypothetical protein